MNVATETTVGSIMQRDIFGVGEDWSLNHLSTFLADKQISGAPVTSKAGDLVGVVSLTDIVRHNSMPESQSKEQHYTHEYYLHTLELQVAQEETTAYHVEEESKTRVKDIMTPMVFQVRENASIEEAADTMIKGRIHRLFITGDEGLVGVVTALDMLKVLSSSFGNE
jgi:predicted transcriptional regulator